MAEPHDDALPTRVSKRGVKRAEPKDTSPAANGVEQEAVETDPTVLATTTRLRRRRRMLARSAPIVVLLIVVIVKALSVPMITRSALDQYTSENFAASIDSFHKLQTLNVAEQWKAHFNEGTAMLANNELPAAEKLLMTAYGLAPELPSDMDAVSDVDALPRCMVQANLSVVYELQGDEAQAAADTLVEDLATAQAELDAMGPNGPTDGSAPADPEALRLEAIETYLQAEELYRTANETRILDGCSENPEAQARNVEKETSAREKRELLENPPAADPPLGQGTDPDDPDDPSSGTDPTQDPTAEPADPDEQKRQEQLEQRAKEGELDKLWTESYGDPGGDVDPSVPQW
jgi:hypothetical protein